MKIVEYTPTKLTIEQNRPVKHWIAGITFMLVGLIAIAGPEQVTTFTCDRTSSTEGICELAHSSLLFSDSTTIFLQDLQAAEIQTNQSSANNSARIVLVTTRAQIPLMADYNSNLEQEESRANTVNQFIQDPNQTNLSIKEDNRLFSYIFGGLFLVTGLVGSGIITKTFTCKFDKSIGSLILIKKGFLWTRTVKKPIADIMGLQVNKPKKKSGKKNYQVSLVLTTGKRIGLASGSEPNLVETKKVIHCITSFLNIDITNYR